MNFDYTPDQRALQAEARRFLAHIGADEAGRVLNEDALRFSAPLWARVCAQGWLGAAIPQTYGGLGLGHVELGVLSEELGRAVAPIPFASTAYVLAEALMLAGTEAQKQRYLPRIAAGEIIGCGAFCEAPGSLIPSPIRTRVRNGRVRGTKLPVMDGSIADVAVVMVDGPVGPELGLVDLRQAQVLREGLRTLDPTSDAARLVFDDAHYEPLSQARGLVEAVLNRAAVLYSLQQIGGAEQCLHLSTDYAKSRQAFGQPIGRFQAIKHKLADMLVANTLARSHAFRGLWALDAPGSDLPTTAAAARLTATEAYWGAARETIQIHGAIGFTWEAGLHAHYRRAHHLSLVLGGPQPWREQLFAGLNAIFPATGKVSARFSDQ